MSLRDLALWPIVIIFSLFALTVAVIFAVLDASAKATRRWFQ